MSEPKAGRKYVVGFAFNSALDNIVLLRKLRPKWQSGLLNGVGGQVEKWDPCVEEAMAREFQEEAALVTKPSDWRVFAILEDSRGWTVHFLMACTYLGGVRTMTDEDVCVVRADELPKNVIPNLRWLIPMALSMASEPRVAYFSIDEVPPS